MKATFAAIAVLALIVPAFALPVVASAEAAVMPGEAASKSDIQLFPPYWDGNDWPSLLVFKGVALKGDEIAPAVFLAMDGEDGRFEQATFIIDGRSSDVQIEDIDRYPKNGAIVVSFDDGSLLLKRYQLNYMDALFASGEYDGWQLNLRMVGNEHLCRLFEPLEQPAVAEQVAAK
ncbi:MAG: hypothetical protein QXF55_02790 [Candidatus Aenigmatarchaeota archaeon]